MKIALFRPWLGTFRARPRLVTSILVGAAVTVALPPDWTHTTVTRALLGWNVGVLLYLVLAGLMMARSDQARMRGRARIEDEGRSVVMLLVMLGIAASVVAIALQLGVAKNFSGAAKLGHIGLAAVTVLTSWAFMQTMFAVHYAHEFYAAPDPSRQAEKAGLEFPGTPDPDYGDFLYMACIIGTSGQTADVAFTSRSMRRIGMVHCVLAFFFNATILAFTINIAASLI
jgi:uncharacterized membrane protein